MWALLSLCHSCEFDYWLRHLPPDVTGPFAARIDDAILEAFEGLTYRGAITDHPYWIQLLQRMRLPPRRHGCGLRSRVELAPVAYASGLVEAVEEMLGPDGFFPMLGPLFGVDEGRPLVQGDRFAVFTGRASGAGEALEACWRAMQDEFDEIPGGGLLSDPVSRAGLGRVGRMQHLLTDQLEERREAHLHRTMLSLSADDGESRYIRQAWLQADRFSMQWASSYPSEDWAIPAALFPIGVCIIMGLPLDALRHRVGAPIPCSAPASAARGGVRHTDAYGGQLCLATQRGDQWRICHDGYERVLLDTLFRCGVKGVEQPATLFGGILPPRRGRRRGRRSGMIPDAMLYSVPLEADVSPRYRDALRQLFDFKCIHGVDHECYRRRDARDVRGGAVESRALEVRRDYEALARRLDARYHAGAPAPGPVLSRLREFPPVRGPVTGAYAEASSVVHALAAHAADEGAARRWRRMGARDAAEARGFLIAHIRRTWGIAGFIASAQLVAHRLETVGLTASPRARPRAWLPPWGLRIRTTTTTHSLSSRMRYGQSCPPLRPWAPKPLGGRLRARRVSP